MKRIIKFVLCLLLIISCFACSNNEENNEVVDEETANVENESSLSQYALNNNGDIQSFDLAFLKFIDKKENIIYSPLSIKYALALLDECADGNSKQELDNILNGYVPNKYTNSENLSLANMIALKDTLSSNLSDDFINELKEKYDAYITKETFTNPLSINNWISDKTFNMINNYIDGFDPDTKFLIINALAMDMEWVNKIQNDFDFSPTHEDYSNIIDAYESEHPPIMNFNNSFAKSVNFTAVANKYDIIKEVGEDTIRDVVKEDILNTSKEYTYLIDDIASNYGGNSEEEAINNYLDAYIESICKNYGQYDESTDFYFYDDENIKVFAKDLKEYGGTSFEYIGIMPKTQDLNTYINNLKSEDIDNIINNLIDPSYDYFEEGYITEIVGEVPTFNFTYNLDLNACLKKLGINDLFDINKANLSKIVGDNPIYIDTNHKSTIEFSNDGIKASAVTMVSGKGAAGYDYHYEVPIKTIDLTFDKPFLFLIRNKDTNDVWFIGTLYEGQIVNNITLYIKVDSIKIRKEPSLSSEQIGSAKLGNSYKASGKIVVADGYTWYEIEDGGWIADDNGKWVS